LWVFSSGVDVEFFDGKKETVGELIRGFGAEKFFIFFNAFLTDDVWR
jgi:hypothetical protein